MLEKLLLESLEDATLLAAKSFRVLSSVPGDLQDFYSEKDLEVIQKIASDKEKDLDNFIDRIERNSNSEMNLSDLVKSSKWTLKNLEKIPTPNESRELYNLHEKAFQEGKISTLENRISNLGLADGIVDIGRVLASLSDPVLTGLYGTASALGIYSKFGNKKHSTIAAGSSAIISILTPALFQIGSFGEDLGTYSGLFLSTSQQLVSLPIILGIQYTSSLKTKNRTKLKEIESTIPNYDKVMEHMLMIPEMINALRYSQNTLNSNPNLSDDYFDDDLDQLEISIRGYYEGDCDLEDVYDRRLRYRPDTRNFSKSRDSKPIQQTPKKVSMSREEYLRLRESGEFNVYRSFDAGGETETAEIRTQSRENSKDDTQYYGFTFLHGKKGSIQGYPIERLEDIIQSKIRDGINSGSKHENIRKSGNGSSLIDIYNPNGPLYKMQPIGALRVLYSRDASEIVVHDILTHEEYEKKMKIS